MMQIQNLQVNLWQFNTSKKSIRKVWSRAPPPRLGTFIKKKNVWSFNVLFITENLGKLKIQIVVHEKLETLTIIQHVQNVPDFLSQRGVPGWLLAGWLAGWLLSLGVCTLRSTDHVTPGGMHPKVDWPCNSWGCSNLTSSERSFHNSSQGCVP